MPTTSVVMPPSPITANLVKMPGIPFEPFRLNTMRGNMPLVVARVLAWAIALGAVAAVAIGYDSLPNTLPVTRWTTAPKSLLIALRVPLINLFTLGLIELLSRALRRVSNLHHSAAMAIVLLLTAAAKAAIESIGILMLPNSIDWTQAPLIAVLALGLGSAAWLGRELLTPGRWRELQLTRAETAGVMMLVVGIAALNLPIVLA
jgi:hypothetical protein